MTQSPVHHSTRALSADRNPARILLLEDQSNALRLMVYLLVSTGYHPIAAGDGRRGVELVKERGADLIITSTNLPTLGGYDLIHELRQQPQLAGVPIIALTERARLASEDDYLADGFTACVGKPIDALTFVRTIERFLPAAKRAQRGLGGAAQSFSRVNSSPTISHIQP